MQFTAILLALAATAFANPVLRRTGGGGGGGGGGGDHGDCPGGGTPPGGVYDACRDVLLYSVPQCCATDVGGVAGLNCANVSELPKSAESFQEICAGSGQQAKCCTLPVLGQALVCNTPIGVTG
ncbi:Cerato-ulmin hydrophobin family [Apiospora hydei]|uniref:Cerato-ulmin hydrophobin family n=1 Tax=Apiospora hydei TaxID=1337664 RepID=A0ABR1WX48_9PEZI